MLAFAVLFGMTASFAQTTAKREVKLPAAMAKELPVNSEKHQRPDLQRQNALLTPHSRQLLGGQRTDRLQMPWQKSTARKALSDEPIYQPEGTYQLYSFNGDGYASSWFGILADHFVGKVAEVVVGSSNDIYVKNLMTEYTYGTWSKGVISGSKVNFDFPHQIELEGSIYYLWLMRYDAEQGTYAAEDGLNTLTLDYDPQTGGMTTPAGSDFATGDVVIGLGDETGAWYGYADYNLSLAPVTDEPVEAPEGLQTEQYSVVADGFDGTIAQVGFVGDEVYVQGLYGGMPEAWIKGVKDGDRVTFKSGQYLGADLSAGFHQYFVSATYDYENDENYGPSYTYYLNNDDVVFTYDAADKSLRTSQTFLVNSGTEQVNYAAVYRGALLRPFTEVAATPAAPEWIEIYNGGWNYYKSGWGWGYVHFNVPCADVDGNYILPDKLSYIIYIRVNGEEKPLELNWYDYRNLTEATMSEMPYAFSDGWDIYANGIEREIYFYVAGPEAFGLQAIYRGAGEERRSEIVWQEFDGVASAVQPDAATPVSAPELNLKTGQSWWSGFELVNHGNRGISRVEYTVEVDGQTYTNEETVNVPNIFGRYTEVPFEIPALSEKGAYPYTITVVKINGEPNEDPSPVISGVCNVYNTLPKHRSVLEEYTGTWCGYCPRGFVGLEEMNRLYPDDFIGVSYHNSDPMEITSQFPNTVSGYPDAWLDRVVQTDAFCGDSQYGTFGIDQAWLKACSVFAPVAVEVESRWADDETLEATAYVTFPLEHAECPYEVGFMLTQDGMTGTESGWTQSNYYSGEEGWPESMDEFTQGGSKVSGLVFNDVLVARSGIAGIQGSLTAPIVADVAQQCSYSFKMSDVVNTSKENIVQDKEKLRIIALVIDTRDGSIVNANKAMAGQSSLTTGIARPALSQDEVVSRVDYYDLQGRRTVKPSQGRLYLKTETLNNGQVRTTKVRM